MTKNIRKGNGFHWKDESETGFGSRETAGFVVDNLNTKELAQANNPYEKLFILIRKTVEENEPLCMDEESDRLQLCQALADRLQKCNLIASPPIRYS